METSFWLERWSKHEIGFHQRRVNAYLQRFWPQLALKNDTSVFVPLCGKTLDMHWLRERGHRVLGVEIARNAVREFFTEWQVEPQVQRSGAFERWSAAGITLLCGDFFALTAGDLVDVAAVFDRASLIALPESMRPRYAQKMLEILPPSAPTMLITVDYAQHEMPGPPFAVGDDEIHCLYGTSRIDVLGEFDVTDAPDNARFRQRGLSKLVERVYRIQTT